MNRVNFSLSQPSLLKRIFQPAMKASSPSLFGREGGEDTPESPTSDLLCRLRDLLAELGSDTRFPEAGGPDRWQRVTTPDVEFHVRQPDDHEARRRLARMARSLSRLLERED